MNSTLESVMREARLERRERRTLSRELEETRAERIVLLTEVCRVLHLGGAVIDVSGRAEGARDQEPATRKFRPSLSRSEHVSLL